jgi:uncharacterized membrane protein
LAKVYHASKVDERDTASRRHYAYLAGIVLVAASVRFVGLSWASLWEDEATWMRLARIEGPVALLRELPKRDAGGSPLHLLLLQAWLKCGNDSLVAARNASALCGLAAVALVYAAGRRFYDRPTGLRAAWLAALNPLDVYHSREVRAYAWLVFLTCAGWYLLDSLRRSAPLWKRALYAMVLISLLYSHPLGSLMVVALAVGSFTILTDSALSWKSLITMNLIAAASFAPWVTRHLDHPPQEVLDHWTAWILLGWPEGFTGGNIGAIVGCWALIVFGIAWQRGRTPRPGLEIGARLSLVWFLVPTLLLLAYSLAGNSIFGPRRYMLFVGPAYLLLVARGISLLPRVSLRLAAMTTLTIMAGTTMASRSFVLERTDWQGAAALIRREEPRAPVVVMDHERRVGHRGLLGFYLDRDHQPIPVCHQVKRLASSSPASLWYVIETAPLNTTLPIPDDLARRYIAERTWTLQGVTLVRARIRSRDSISLRDEPTIRPR